MKHKKRNATHPLEPNKDEYCYANDKVKRKYKSELDASLNAPGRKLQQYICEYCGYWHNGNSNASDPKTKR